MKRLKNTALVLFAATSVAFQAPAQEEQAAAEYIKFKSAPGATLRVAVPAQYKAAHENYVKTFPGKPAGFIISTDLLDATAKENFANGPNSNGEVYVALAQTGQGWFFAIPFPMRTNMLPGLSQVRFPRMICGEGSLCATDCNTHIGHDENRRFNQTTINEGIRRFRDHNT